VSRKVPGETVVLEKKQALWQAAKVGRYCVAVVFVIGLALALSGCSKPPQPPVPEEAAKPTGLESIPASDPLKYPRISDMANWKNPYLVVREDGIGMVDLSNHEIHMLKPEEVPAELVALSPTAWPYGRAVLIAQAIPKDASEQTKTNLRKNRALLIGTLKELDVQYQEAP
jgi:hypothetical protein